MAHEVTFQAKASWPPKGHVTRLIVLDRWQKLLEGDVATIQAWARTFRQKKYPADEFVPFPAPEIAARTLATFLFGEDAAIKTPTQRGQEYLKEMVEDNHLHSLNQEAAITAASPGEVYYKLDWDQEVSDDPIISTVAPNRAFPLFKFGRLVECTFVHYLDPDILSVQSAGTVRIRHVEIRQRGLILHRLFRGSDDSLGMELPLEAHPDTVEFQPVVETDIDDILVRHVPFWRTSGDPYGISIFRGKEGLIDAIHSLYSQDQHDAEMSKRRVGVASNYLKRDANGRPVFDRSLDLFELDEEAAGAIGAESKPLHAIEFTDSTVMGQRIAQRFDEFLLACGIAPQSAGRDVAGGAESGTARKLAQTLTLQTINTAGRYFAPALKDILELGTQMAKGILNHPRAFVLSDVSVEMKDGFVDDPVENAARIASLRGAKVISVEQAVRELHPEWDEDAVEEEVERIKDEEGLKLPDVLAGVREGTEGPPQIDQEASGAAAQGNNTGPLEDTAPSNTAIEQ